MKCLAVEYVLFDLMIRRPAMRTIPEPPGFNIYCPFQVLDKIGHGTLTFGHTARW